MKRFFYVRNGFTLIEVLISIGIIVILVTATVIIIDPPRQLAKGRNQQRHADINIIINAIGQNIADNRGVFSCSSGSVPAVETRIASSTGNYNIGPCLVSAYLNNLPIDPSASGVSYIDENDYDTGYHIVQSATTTRITVSAPGAELEETIEITR